MMKNTCKIFFFFVFMMACSYGFSQDLIIKKDGSKIRCRIVDENSTSLYYSIGEQKTLFELKKTEVEHFYLATDPGSNSAKTAPATVKRDEIVGFNFMVGASAPTKDFASSDVQKNTAGLARLGYLIEASVDFKLSKFFALSAAFLHQSNGIDNASLIDYYMNSAPAGYSFSVSTTPWVSNGFYGGMCVTTPHRKEKNLFFDFSIYAGYPKFSSPQLTIQVLANKQLLGTVSQDVSSASAFALFGGAGIHYKLSDYISFRAGINYFTAKPSFSNVAVKGASGTAYSNFSQQITTVNIQVGVMFSIH